MSFDKIITKKDKEHKNSDRLKIEQELIFLKQSNLINMENYMNSRYLLIDRLALEDSDMLLLERIGSANYDSINFEVPGMS